MSQLGPPRGSHNFPAPSHWPPKPPPIDPLDQLAAAGSAPPQPHGYRRAPAPAANVGLVVALTAAGLVVLTVLFVALARQRPRGDRPSTVFVPSSSSATPAGRRPAEVTTDAEGIVGAYQTNEVAADRQFRGKVVQVSGVVERIHRNIADQPFVTLEAEGGRSVQCFFLPEVTEADLAGLRPGDVLTVRGRCDGLWINVQMRDCTIRD